MNLRHSHWAIYFLCWLLAIIGGGALIGAIVFPLLGPLFGSNRTPLAHAIVGARHLGFIALIWAPGIALVACVMRSRRNKSPQ